MHLIYTENVSVIAHFAFEKIKKSGLERVKQQWATQCLSWSVYNLSMESTNLMAIKELQYGMKHTVFILHTIDSILAIQ